MEAARQYEKADDRGNSRQHDIQDEDHGRLAGDRAQRFFLQVPAAQIDEQHLHDADVGQIKRIAQRGKKDEQREPLRREHAGKHKRLQETRGQGAGRRRGAQRHIAVGDQALGNHGNRRGVKQREWRRDRPPVRLTPPLPR